MRGILILTLIGLVSACGGAEAGDSRGGTGGSGGSGVTDEQDATCRAFCANEPEGSTCGPGARWGGNIQQCYEGCLNELSQMQCKAEWIAELECHLDLDCDDIFGDCERANLEEAWQECEQRAQADAHCAEQCPEQNREECITQYQYSGQCGEGPTPRDPEELCNEVCSWPDGCFAELGAPLGGADCTENCLDSTDVVGAACLGAIADTVACLGTCDVESITQEQALACQDEAAAISGLCEENANTIENCALLADPPPDCGQPCTSDTQCAGSYCSNGTCEAECTANQGCGGNEVCNSRGRCVLVTGI